jgi:general secretion pathway protein J
MMRRQAGFTLVEVLVALSVATLLVALVYGAVRVGQRSAMALTDKSEQTEVMQLGWQYLHTAVGRARPFGDPEDTDNRIGFEGGGSRLVLHADVPTYVGISGLMRIALETRAGERGQQLVLTRRGVVAGEATDAPLPSEQAVLVESLDRLQLSYFGAKTRGDVPTWHGSWTGARRLPNLIRISVKPKGARAWPVLIARPLTGSAALGEDDLPDGESATEVSG